MVQIIQFRNPWTGAAIHMERSFKGAHFDSAQPRADVQFKETFIPAIRVFEEMRCVDEEGPAV